MKIDKCIRTNRKTLALVVNENAELIVRAPKRMPMREIEAFVREKEAWIMKQQNRMKALPKKPRCEYREGETFLFLGEPFVLKIEEENKNVAFSDGCLYLPYTQRDRAEKAVKQWYKAEAQRILCERVRELEALTGLQSAGLRVTFAKTRWGSCTAKNTLNFTARLIMAPSPVIDSVVAHELCHTVHHNHANAFWKLLYSILPDYKRRHQWLMDHQREMEL